MKLVWWGEQDRVRGDPLVLDFATVFAVDMLHMVAVARWLALYMPVPAP